jgi:hypothetical protein
MARQRRRYSSLDLSYSDRIKIMFTDLKSNTLVTFFEKNGNELLKVVVYVANPIKKRKINFNCQQYDNLEFDKNIKVKYILISNESWDFDIKAYIKKVKINSIHSSDNKLTYNVSLKFSKKTPETLFKSPL